MIAQMHPAPNRDTEKDQGKIREQEQGSVHGCILIGGVLPGGVGESNPAKPLAASGQYP